MSQPCTEFLTALRRFLEGTREPALPGTLGAKGDKPLHLRAVYLGGAKVEQCGPTFSREGAGDRRLQGNGTCAVIGIDTLLLATADVAAVYRISDDTEAAPGRNKGACATRHPRG